VLPCSQAVVATIVVIISSSSSSLLSFYHPFTFLLESPPPSPFIHSKHCLTLWTYHSIPMFHPTYTSYYSLISPTLLSHSTYKPLYHLVQPYIHIIQSPPALYTHKPTIHNCHTIPISDPDNTPSPYLT
jgi:hypothetical protein